MKSPRAHKPAVPPMNLTRVSRLLLAAPVVLCLLAPLAAAADPAAGAIPDTRGPVQNAHEHIVQTLDGIDAPGFSYRPFDPVKTWSAQWINSAAPGIPGVTTALLRKEIDLAAPPAKVTAYLTAGKYILYVNGQMASRGPADFGRDFDGGSSQKWFYDARDLTSLFHAGKNVIAAECLGGPGFIFQAEVQTGDGHSTTIVSDTSWHGAAAAHLKDHQFDGNAEPVGWQVAGFNAAAWPACRVVGAPKEPLTLSEIPALMEARYRVQGIVQVTGGAKIPDRPFQEGHSVTVTSDASFAVRFDRVMAGRLGIAVKGGKGAEISIYQSELPDGKSKPYVLTLRDGLQYFEQADFNTLGTIHVSVSKVTSPVEILDVSADEGCQPVAYQGSFTCSDELLNKIWTDCRWVTEINLQTHHLDSPSHQEPICDYGDYLIEDLVTYDAFGDNPWLARQDLRKWAWVMKSRNYETFHTSYRLLWLQALLNYYDYTGDKALVVELAPYVHELLDQFTGYIGKNGIISNAPNYMFMDWVQIGGLGAHHPPAVVGQGYMTAFYYKGLAEGMRVAALTNNPERASKYAKLREQVALAYNRELWDANKGLYRDGRPNQSTVPPSKWLPADKNIETFSAQNNVLAVLYDLAPADKQGPIIDTLLGETTWNVRPYYMNFVLGAVAHAGLFNKYGTVWMRKWKINPDTQSFQEMGTSGDFGHGWTGTPLIQMSSQVLGITPAAPNFDAVSIRPMPGDLTFAKGTVPTAHGPVDVKWQRQADRLALTVTVPPGITGTVAFPVGQARTPSITANGAAIWPQGSTAGKANGIRAAKRVGPAVEIQVDAGTYDFAGSML